jgi:hypothetical protein
MLAYLLLDVGWDADSYGAADLAPAVASFAFDLGNLGSANIWLAMGSFAISSGWMLLSTRALGRWLGWWAIVAGIGLILVRFAWSGEIWFAAVRTLLAVGDHRLHPADPPNESGLADRGYGCACDHENAGAVIPPLRDALRRR